MYPALALHTILGGLDIGAFVLAAILVTRSNMDVRGVRIALSMGMALLIPSLRRWRLTRRLLLDGLPEPPHRSGSPTVARGSQPYGSQKPRVTGVSVGVRVNKFIRFTTNGNKPHE